jgi:hypothetical protein
MPRSLTTLIAIAVMAAASTGCTPGAGNPASSSNVAAQPTGGQAVVTLPTGATLTGGKFTDAQVETMLACATAKPGSTSVVTILQQYKVANGLQRGLADPVVEKYAKELGCL